MQPSPARPAARLPLALHAGWEAVLLVAVIALVIAIEAGDHHPPSLWKALSGSLSVLLLETVAVAVSLRARNLNFAVVGVAFVTGFFVADWSGGHGMPLLVASLLAIVLATVVGAVFGAVAGLTGAPGWAASLVLLALVAAIGLAQGPELRTLPSDEAPDHPQTWFTLLILLGIVGSVAGGVLWQLTPLRRALAVEPDRPAGAGARMLGGIVGLGLSTGIAALAGVAYVIWTLAAFPTQAGGLPLTPLAIAVFGGVSVFGGRGGFAGTALASVAAALLMMLGRMHGWPTWIISYLLPAIMLAVGIALSLVLRRVSGERPAPAPIWSPLPPPGFGPPAPFPAGMAPAPAFPQPGVPQPSVPQPGVPQLGFPQPLVPQPGVPQPGVPQPGVPHPGVPQPGFPQASYPGPAPAQPLPAQPGVPQLAQPGVTQPGQPASTQIPPASPGVVAPGPEQPGQVPPAAGQ
jgi:ribose transport system permease protein